jgi:hypothetical protein
MKEKESTKSEKKLLTNIDKASKIVLKEDEKLFKELGKEKDKFEEMQQRLMNLSEMLNSKIYNLMIEFADMRHEIKQLQMNLFELRQELK